MKNLFTFLVVLSAMSCGEYALIGIKTPYTPSYKELTGLQQQQVQVLAMETAMCDFQNEGKVLAISAAQLTTCLAQNDTSVVYVWSANCKAESCILIKACQDYCDAHNYKLYVLSENYNLPIIEAQNNSHFPMLAANHTYYNTHRNEKRKNRFIQELIGSDKSKRKTINGRFLIFYKDELISRRSDLYNE